MNQLCSSRDSEGEDEDDDKEENESPGADDEGDDEDDKLKSEVANLESRLRAKCDKIEYYARLRKKGRSEYEDLKSKTLELESKLADEGDDGADDESAPAQAQADEARLADDGAAYTCADCGAKLRDEDYCECCGAELRDDDYREGCGTWPTPAPGAPRRKPWGE